MIGSPLATGPCGLLLPGQLRPVLPSQLVVPQGLIAYLGFDPDCIDFHAGKAFDLSGSGNTFGLISGPTLAQGVVGTGLSFSGGSRASNTTTVAAQLAGAVTASFSGWVFRSATTNSIGFDFHDSAPYRTGLTWSTDGNLYVYTDVASAQFAGVALAGTGWHHVTMVFNGAQSGTNALGLIAYIDGVKQSLTYSGLLPSALASSANLGAFYVGFTNLGASNGTVDEVRIYNRNISPWENQQLYQAGLAGRRDAGAPSLAAMFLPPVTAVPWGWQPDDAPFRPRRFAQGISLAETTFPLVSIAPPSNFLSQWAGQSDVARIPNPRRLAETADSPGIPRGEFLANSLAQWLGQSDIIRLPPPRRLRDHAETFRVGVTGLNFLSQWVSQSDIAHLPPLRRQIEVGETIGVPRGEFLVALLSQWLGQSDIPRYPRPRPLGDHTFTPGIIVAPAASFLSQWISQSDILRLPPLRRQVEMTDVLGPKGGFLQSLLSWFSQSDIRRMAPLRQLAEPSIVLGIISRVFAANWLNQSDIVRRSVLRRTVSEYSEVLSHAVPVLSMGWDHQSDINNLIRPGFIRDNLLWSTQLVNVLRVTMNKQVTGTVAVGDEIQFSIRDIGVTVTVYPRPLTAPTGE